MKRTVHFLLMAMFTVSCLNAQVTFFDDFESYASGDMIAQASSDWTTWSNAPGGQEDSPISDEQAYSGTNSLRFESGTPGGGGPADVVLPFGGQYENGLFTYEMYMYVPEGNGAYFNFQGRSTIGQVWSLQYFMLDSGDVLFRGDGNGALDVRDLTFPFDQWFSIKVIADMTYNKWEVFVDGMSAGIFSNPDNSIASIDIYPLNQNTGGTSLFYIDDVSFSYEEPDLAQLDATMLSVTAKPGVLTGRDVSISGEVRNVGLDAITEMEVSWSDGTNSYTDMITGINVPSLENYAFEHTVPYTALDGENMVSVSIGTVNGVEDGDVSNNGTEAAITGYTPATNRKVLVEEGTGTWCGWCPRGEVLIEQMIAEYGDYFIPIAVHAGDPMEISGYAEGLGFNAFPTMMIGREEIFGFGVIEDIESRFFQRIINPTPAILSATAAYDGTNLTFTAHAQAMSAASGAHRLAMVLVEDGVTGTTSSYNQVNYYAGGNFGPMGGYENLPDPVPAADMVYNHVGRLTLGGVDGAEGSLPMTLEMGQTYSYEFETFEKSNAWNLTKMKVVTLLLDADGVVVNAVEENLSDLIDLTNTSAIYQNHLAKVYPNPTSGWSTIELNLEQASQTQIRIFNAVGQEVARRDYGQLSGTQYLPFDGQNFDNGVYYIHIQLDETLITKKITLNR